MRAMSGRVGVRLSDGRFVRGYRKTLARRAPRTPPHLRQAWELSLILPGDDMRFFGVSDGPTPVMCVEARRAGSSWQIVAVGRHREFVATQMVRWLKSMAPDYARPLNATLHRPADKDGPTLSGPRHGPETCPCQITLWPKPYLKFGSGMRPITL